MSTILSLTTMSNASRSNKCVFSRLFLRLRITLSFKAKGLLSYILSLPNDWNYSISGLVYNAKENKTHWIDLGETNIPVECDDFFDVCSA